MVHDIEFEFEFTALLDLSEFPLQEKHMSSSLQQRMKRIRKARDRDEDQEPELNSPLKNLYESYTLPWDSSKSVSVGQRVAVCVTRTTSVCDVLWADGTIERELPMDTFGFELFEDYMQGPTFIPGDLVLPPHSANPVSGVRN